MKMWFVYKDGEFVYQCFSSDAALKYIRRKLSGKKHAESKQHDWTYDYRHSPRRMTVQEAFRRVMKDIKKMTPEELRAELDNHRNGEVARVLRDVRSFMESEFYPGA